MPPRSAEPPGRTRHGAQGSAPHRPIAPGIYGVRCPPRTRCFRGLFLRAGAANRQLAAASRNRLKLPPSSGPSSSFLDLWQSPSWHAKSSTAKNYELKPRPRRPAEELPPRKAPKGQEDQSQGREKGPRQRKSRSKTAEPERRKLFWGVFNQSAKRVALFDFSQRKAAEAKAGELTASGKNQHFVMKVKEAISG